MRKYCLITTLCVLVGACQQVSTIGTTVPSHSLIKVSWEQEGKSCVYKESYGNVMKEWDYQKDKFEKKEYIASVRTIKYGDTPCSKIIDAELKNKTNKSAISNQFH